MCGVNVIHSCICHVSSTGGVPASSRATLMARGSAATPNSALRTFPSVPNSAPCTFSYVSELMFLSRSRCLPPATCLQRRRKRRKPQTKPDSRKIGTLRRGGAASIHRYAASYLCTPNLCGWKLWGTGRACRRRAPTIYLPQVPRGG